MTYRTTAEVTCVVCCLQQFSKHVWPVLPWHAINLLAVNTNRNCIRSLFFILNWALVPFCPRKFSIFHVRHTVTDNCFLILTMTCFKLEQIVQWSYKQDILTLMLSSNVYDVGKQLPQKIDFKIYYSNNWFPSSLKRNIFYNSRRYWISFDVYLLKWSPSESKAAVYFILNKCYYYFLQCKNLFLFWPDSSNQACREWNQCAVTQKRKKPHIWQWALPSFEGMKGFINPVSLLALTRLNLI